MNKKEQAFVEFLWDWYEKCGRHNLPWRQTTDPYLILVSELMLQQTQVQRVVPKYDAFISRWPNVASLAQASLGEVLTMWQGLGYNRRAKFLWQCAQTVTVEHNGVFPNSYEELLKLPGVGPYTASAICAFAYNQPVTLIETNVRQVYIHHFFSQQESVTDVEILAKVTKTLPPENARAWYAAIMDYGTYLKQQYGNNTRKVQGYTKQSTFKGSKREVRGAIIRALAKKPLSLTELEQLVTAERIGILHEQLAILQTDEMVVTAGKLYQLP